MSSSFQEFSSPIGKLFLVETGNRLRAITFEGQWPSLKERFDPCVESETPLLKETKRQLGLYFAGQLKSFDLPIAVEGTDFQKRVWSALGDIPFGVTKTYKEQALSVDAPAAVRAVGRTNGLNMLPIVLPCHRVVGSNGKLTGYAGGLHIKEFLLKHEADVLRVGA